MVILQSSLQWQDQHRAIALLMQSNLAQHAVFATLLVQVMLLIRQNADQARRAAVDNA